jgi:hypothetical protein
VRPSPERGRREFVAILVAALLIQVLIGTMATLRGDTIAWGSLAKRPLLLVALWIVAIASKRVGHVLLVAWFAFLAVMYAYGGFAAGYATLMVLRWIAAAFFAFGAVRLATGAHIRAYRDDR